MEPDARPELRIGLTTCPPDKAADLAETLVERGLAACVNIVPGLESIYRWEGKVVHDHEALLVMKTTAGRLEALKAALLEAHVYEVPEFVVLPVEAAHAPYMDWVLKSVS